MEGELVTSGIEKQDNVVDSQALETTSSVLTITGTRQYMNGRQYKCMADLDGFASVGTVQPLFQEFKLSIQCTCFSKQHFISNLPIFSWVTLM